MPPFAPVDPRASLPELEHEVLALWDRIDAFRRSVEQRPEDRRYAFYDGPPFATGLPHYGHLVASTLKDVVPRYWTMRGRRVERRFGWDTHGLPIEMEMEKALGLNGPAEIRAYGVDRFNEACRANVLRYTAEWERIIRRLGRWVDFENDYKTMDPPFMESVWWVFRQLWDRGLVYRDVRVMPFSWRLSTPLSNFEANLDYRDVQDPAITVRLRVLDAPEPTWLLIWTTTPWTLPSNLAVAAGEEVRYVRARRPGEPDVSVLAAARVRDVLGEDAEVLGELTGRELVGWRYEPLFPFYAELAEPAEGREPAFRVILADHVTDEDGTGLVHMAPAYGEEDFEACRAAGLPVVDPVDEQGRFTDPVAPWKGRHVKEADPDIIRDLKRRGLLLRHETIQHPYPFCWRSGTPLIYKTVPVWQVRVTELRDRLVEANREVHWVPEAVGTRRFGNWLAEARDWTISRSRFWGTPIPLWVCEDCGHVTCIGSVVELEAATGERVTDLHPHRIDHLTLACPSCGGTSRRIPDVFDCWFESGAMPYAQVHYPFENREAFEASFPAEFIAEGLDQTRGWFYTLLVLGVALFDRSPYRNVVVNGLVLAEDGAKMSKSKRNYPDPADVLERYGADALRAYLVDSPVVRAEPLRFSERGVRDVVRTVILPLRNAWAFFVQYANIDGWTPQAAYGGDAQWAAPPLAERPELDRWIVSVLQSLVRDVNEQMEGYYLYKVVPPMVGFIDHLTNWYIRRSRKRFWRSADDPEARRDKAAAYATLYEVLVTFAKVMAPVLPFVTEALYQNLVVEQGQAPAGRDSIHLCDYPEVDPAAIDEKLEREVAWVRQVVRMGRAQREKHRIRTRQPLPALIVVHHDPEVREALSRHQELLLEELNVKRLVLREADDELADMAFKPNFPRLGPRLGKAMGQAARAIAEMDRATWRRLEAGEALEVAGHRITAEDVVVQRTARPGVVLEVEGAMTVALDTNLTPELVAEGLVRELVNRVQRMRKAAGLEPTDRIVLRLGSTDAAFREAVQRHRDTLAEAVLAVDIDLRDALEGGEALDLDGVEVQAAVERAN